MRTVKRRLGARVLRNAGYLLLIGCLLLATQGCGHKSVGDEGVIRLSRIDNDGNEVPACMFCCDTLYIYEQACLYRAEYLKDGKETDRTTDETHNLLALSALIDDDDEICNGDNVLILEEAQVSKACRPSKSGWNDRVFKVRVLGSGGLECWVAANWVK